MEQKEAQILSYFKSNYSEITNQALLIWMRTTLQLTPSGYCSIFSAMAKCLPMSVLDIHVPNNEGRKQKKKTVRCKPVKKGEKIKRRSLCRRKSLNNPSLIQEALSDGVHTNHKPTSAATQVQYPQGPKAALTRFTLTDYSWIHTLMDIRNCWISKI